MSATSMHPSGRPVDPLLSNDVIAHLDVQIASAARLLEYATAQSHAIRERDVDGIVAQVTGFQAELERRTRIEDERTRLLARAGHALRLPPEAVTLTRLTLLMSPDHAHVAGTRSRELQRLLDELTVIHQANQALMRQELAFLDHLLNVLEPLPGLGYEPSGTRNSMPVAPLPGHHNLDLHA